MPMFVQRLRRSDTWIDGKYDHEAGWVAVNLWMSSWHSEVASSLEDSDNALSEAAMIDRTRWMQIRERALKGWVLCNDGRWYHPVVAECALKAWKIRCRFRASLGVARDAKKAKAARQDARQAKLWPGQKKGRRSETVSQAEVYRHAMSAEMPDLSAEMGGWPDGPADNLEPSADETAILSAETGDLSAADAAGQGGYPPDVANTEAARETAEISVTGLKSEGRRLKEGSLRSPAARASRARRECVRPDPKFDIFMAQYPIGGYPRFTRMEWDAAIERGADPDDILDGLSRHVFPTEQRWVPSPGKWLAGECWQVADIRGDGFDPVLRAAGLTPADFANEPEALLQ